MGRATDEALRKMTIFRRLSPEDRQHILEVSHLTHYPRGEVIFREGDPADMFLAIIEGRVKVFKAAPGGKEIILEIFGAGDPLGAVAVYESRDLPASAVALEDTDMRGDRSRGLLPAPRSPSRAGPRPALRPHPAPGRAHASTGRADRRPGRGPLRAPLPEARDANRQTRPRRDLRGACRSRGRSSPT